eukprot:GHVH01005822.1.p1 GENE.GHVH01005822.1~~GHVH01005822.1.p1  ORF type:complete len:804 (-),score=86.28 GHVH01005822.1:2503-4914(-)
MSEDTITSSLDNIESSPYYHYLQDVDQGRRHLTLRGLQSELPITIRVRSDECRSYIDEIKNKHREFTLLSSLADWEVYQFPNERYHGEVKTVLEMCAASGWIQFQELVSLIPIYLMYQLRGPSRSLLDLCAAPGSKTVAATDILYHNDSLIVANDADVKRCALTLTRNLSLRPHAGVIVIHSDGSCFAPSFCRPSSDPSGLMSYSNILCDVPCSGDGTIKKNATLLDSWSPTLGLSLHPVQLKLLRKAISLGGMRTGDPQDDCHVIYSTCSMNPIENEAVVIGAVMGSLGLSKLPIWRSIFTEKHFHDSIAKVKGVGCAMPLCDLCGYDQSESPGPCHECIAEMISEVAPVHVVDPTQGNGSFMSLILQPHESKRYKGIESWRVPRNGGELKSTKFKGKLRHVSENIEVCLEYLTDIEIEDIIKYDNDREMSGITRKTLQHRTDHETSYHMTMLPPEKFVCGQLSSKIKWLLSDDFTQDKDNYWKPLRLVWKTLYHQIATANVNSDINFETVNHLKDGLIHFIKTRILEKCYRIWPARIHGGFFAAVLKIRPSVFAPANVPRIGGCRMHYSPRFIRSNQSASPKGFCAFRFWPLRSHGSTGTTDLDVVRDDQSRSIFKELQSFYDIPVFVDSDGYFRLLSSERTELGYVWYRESTITSKISSWCLVNASLDGWCKMEVAKWDNSGSYLQLGTRLFAPLTKGWSGKMPPGDARSRPVCAWRPGGGSLELLRSGTTRFNRVLNVTAEEFAQLYHDEVIPSSALLGGCFIRCSHTGTVENGYVSYRGLSLCVKKKKRSREVQSLQI